MNSRKEPKTGKETVWVYRSDPGEGEEIDPILRPLVITVAGQREGLHRIGPKKID